MTENSTVVTLTRAELYERVWQTPMRILAPQLGLSDVGLAKTCRRASIPVPPVGYWAKRQHGKTVRRPALPRRSDDAEPLRFEVKPRAPREPSVAPTLHDPALVSELARLKEVGDLVVPASVEEMHPITESLSLALDRATKRGDLDRSGIVRPHWRKGDARIGVEVAASSVPRVLRLVDAIVRHAELLATLRTWRREASHWMGLALGDDRFDVRIAERCRRYRNSPAPDTRRYWEPAFVTRACGELSIQLSDGKSRVVASWHDTPHRTVESRIARLFDALPWAVQKSRELDEAERVAEAARIEREKAEAIRRHEAQRLAIESARQEAERRERRARELAEIRSLCEQAEAWAAANRIREYARMMRDRALGSNVPADKVHAWVESVWAVAARLDPQRIFPPSPPAKDVLEAIRAGTRDGARGW